ncbi:MAG TPA: hypothetical protein VGX03_19010 [Candidatus Binatia bacterium]|nr:hypothetical protein [Candidatus Binatia bacterium]
MRKIIYMAAIGLPLLFLLSVYAIPPTVPESPLWTVRLRAAHSLVAGDAVEEAGHRIGQVVGITPYSEPNGEVGTDIFITLDPSSRDRLRERATFLVTKPAGRVRPVLTLVVFDEHSPPLPPGSQIAGAESELELELKRQVVAMEGAVRVFSRQIDDLRQTLDKASHSEERKRLDDSVGGLAETLRRTRDDALRVFTEEMGRWKKFYDKLFPPERAKPVRFVS